MGDIVSSSRSIILKFVQTTGTMFMPDDVAWSVCSHDCPSACTLDVEIVAPNRIGRVYGSKINPYTAGVVCAKVAR